MYSNLKIELMQSQVYRFRGKLFDSNKSIPWPRKRNLEN